MINFNLIYEKAKLVLINPEKFFKKYKKEKGLEDAFAYFAVLSFIGVVLGIISYYLFAPYSSHIIKAVFKVSSPSKTQLGLGRIILFSLWGWVFTLIGGFISAGVLHVYLLIFGGKAKYEDTYRMYAYAKTPVFLLEWIPIVGSLAWFWEIFLLIIGTQKIHKMSRRRSILIYVIPVLLLIILITAIIFVVFSIIKSHPEILAKLNQ
jgi:hypothetical protein